MAQPEYEVTLYWDLDMEVALTSKVVTGLVELARRGRIRLRPSVALTRDENRRPAGHVMVWLEAKKLADGCVKKVAMDLHDLSFQFYNEALEECDVYFKKSYYPPDIELHASAQGDKVRPFGFNFWCATDWSKAVVMRWLMRLYTRLALRSPSDALTRFRRELGYYRVFMDGPTLRDFEQDPNKPLLRKVIFQTRVWRPEEVGSDSCEAVNTLRVETIRALKRHFGNAFVGGLVPTALARAEYADVLADKPSRRQKFVRWSKRMLVGIYVRGLNYSYGFRFAEHLAASQCVVAHPDGFRNPPPEPAQEGVHYLAFTTPEECVVQCQKLLEDEALARRMREANWDYYQREIAPSQHVLNCLRRAFGRLD